LRPGSGSAHCELELAVRREGGKRRRRRRSK
jgi:hypothetical protein